MTAPCHLPRLAPMKGDQSLLSGSSIQHSAKLERVIQADRHSELGTGIKEGLLSLPALLHSSLPLSHQRKRCRGKAGV